MQVKYESARAAAAVFAAVAEGRVSRWARMREEVRADVEAAGGVFTVSVAPGRPVAIVAPGGELLVAATPVEERRVRAGVARYAPPRREYAFRGARLVAV